MGELEPLHCDFGRQVPFTPLAVHVLGVLGLGLGDPDEAVGVQHWMSVGSSGQYPGVDSLEPVHCDVGRQVPFLPLTVQVLGELGDDGVAGVQHCTSAGSSGQYPGVDLLEPLHCDVGKHVPFAPVVLTVHGLGGLGDPDGLVGVQHLRRSSVSSMIRQMVPQPLPGHS